ncbi:eCIS core domain-containing protein [Azospirillum largimobile]
MKPARAPSACTTDAKAPAGCGARRATPAPDPHPLADNRTMQALLRGGTVRAKLEIGGIDDPEEREADAVADRVMQSAEGACCAACAGGDQRQGDTVRRTAGAGTAPYRAHMPAARIRGLAGGGEALSPRLRGFFEPRLGADLSGVRLHTGPGAAAAARSIGARAFTHRADVAFAAGQYAPDTAGGMRLLAHELAHVSRGHAGGSPVRRQAAAPANAPAPEPAPDSGTVTAAVDVIIDALEGYTTAGDSETILGRFRGKGAAHVNALVDGVKGRGHRHGKNGDQMVDWLLGDLTEENRRELRRILIQSRNPDVERIVAGEIVDLLAGYTSEADSTEIVQLCTGFSGMALDGLLVRIETSTGRSRNSVRDQLFGDLDRINAERLRQLFFRQGGPIATGYATAWTAGKIMDLLAGYTSGSDSTAIVRNFDTTPQEFRGLVQVRLDELCRASRNNQSAQDALMHDMHAGDYETLRTMGGLTLAPYVDTRTTAEKVVAKAEWTMVVLEWVACGLGGIVTGLLSVLWDLAVGLKDIAVAVWDILWSLVYLFSGGAAGSDNWLRVKTFFTGVGSLFTDTGKVWDQYWEEQALEFRTVEGPLADCRRAEFWVRKIVSGIVNVVLILVAGYGLAKGAVSGARTAAGTAELVEAVGIRGVVSAGARIAARRLGRFVTASAEAAGKFIQVVKQPLALAQAINTRLRVVLIAAEDVGYWQYLRRQAGAAAGAVGDLAAEQLAAEQRFWSDQRRFWRERGVAQQARGAALAEDLGTVEHNLTNDPPRQPEDPATIGDLADDAAQLDTESARLNDDVVKAPATPAEQKAAQPGIPSASEGPASPPSGTAAAAAGGAEREATIEQLIEESLAGHSPEPSAPLNPAEFQPPAPPQRPVYTSLRQIDPASIPPGEAARYRTAYPRYVARRQREIAAGTGSGRPILSEDDYIRARWGYDSGLLRRGAHAGPTDLGRTGAIEQEAGRAMQKIVDTRLPPSSSNTAVYPNPHGDPVIPDHLPPGAGEVFLDAKGHKAATGRRFSARFVGDSKYLAGRVPIDGQTRGLVNLARFSDDKTLVFYIRWQGSFPAAESLTFDSALGGRVMPVRPWNEQLVSPALREFARQRGVKIRLVSDPLWT